MPTLTPTKTDGATVRPNELIYVEPAWAMTDEDLPPALVSSDLNARFVTDFLSAVLTHERCGRHLYRSVAERSDNAVLRHKYKELGEETERHAALCEELIRSLGGNPGYVSAMARAVEGTDTQLLQSTFLLSGGLDPMTRETSMLDAVLLAETVDHGHWELMGQLRDELPEGELRSAFSTAVDEVAPEEAEHLEWARSTKARLSMLQARSSFAAEAGMKVEEMTAKVRDWFSSD